MRHLILSFLILGLVGCSNRPVPLSVPPTQALAPALVGQPYQAQISVTGGSRPYTFEVIAGAMPAGLVMDPATGIISGTPTLQGTFTFAVQVTDSHGTNN